MPDEKPSKEIIHNDEKLDNWLIKYERTMAQKMSTKHEVKPASRRGLNG